MTSAIYSHPRYYDIAFGFVNIPEQVDLFERYIAAYSRTPVRTVLDLCCGPAPQLREFVRRGYRALGVDLCPEALDYAREAAAAENVAIETLLADVTDFALAEPADFAFNLMGSIAYVGDNAGMLAHLSAVAAALRPGGLYLIENLASDWSSPLTWAPQSWRMERDGITVHSTYQVKPREVLAQTVDFSLEMQIDDHGHPLHLVERQPLKLYFPREFASLVETHGAFEFLGYFERYDTKILQDFHSDHNALLRKRLAFNAGAA